MYICMYVCMYIYIYIYIYIHITRWARRQKLLSSPWFGAPKPQSSHHRRSSRTFFADAGMFEGASSPRAKRVPEFLDPGF